MLHKHKAEATDERKGRKSTVGMKQTSTWLWSNTGAVDGG